MTQQRSAPAKGLTFVHSRIVKWGDTDPAGIVYTPRVLDYAMEAVEAWYRDVLGTPWRKLNVERKLGSPFVKASVEFVKPIQPDQKLDVALVVASIGRSTLTFAMEGRGERGAVHFRATMKACIVDLKDYRPTPLPPDFRAAAEAYHATRDGED